jgi:hypothetical protein
MKHKKVMITPRYRLLMQCILLIAMSNLATAAALRGQLVRSGPNGMRYPASGISVTVYSPTMGRSAAFQSGPDGMFYLQVPPGSYYLEVWINPNPGAQPLVYQIQVGEPYTDIPPVVLP